jgi:hypothetical protein
MKEAPCRARHRGNDDIKKGFEDIDAEYVDWILERWWALVDVVMNLRVSQLNGISLFVLYLLVCQRDIGICNRTKQMVLLDPVVRMSGNIYVKSIFSCLKKWLKA